MRINKIGNYYNTAFKASSDKKPEEKKPLSKTAQIVYGTAGAVALGLAAYFIVRKKGAAAVTENLPTKIKTQPAASEKAADKVSSEASKVAANTTPPAQQTPPVERSIQPKYKLPKTNTKIDDFKPFFDSDYEIIKSGKTITYKSVAGDNTFRDILLLNNEKNLTGRILITENKNGQKSIRVYKGNETNILDDLDALPNGRYDTNFFVKEISKEAPKPFKGYSENGKEKLLYIIKNDGSIKSYQSFYDDNNRIHELNVYDQKAVSLRRYIDKNDFPEIRNTIQYKYEYVDNKLSSLTKQYLTKDGKDHGIYTNNGFDPFPVEVIKY